jgi:hypothetical protein
MVRQSCASEDRNQWTPADVRGPPWTQRCGPKDRRHPHRSGSPTQEPLDQAEGEGFEPSIRLTTDNGFRDRFEYAGLQGFLSLCASVCASQPALLQRADIER